MQDQETVYELSMVRERLDELDKILRFEKSSVGVAGKRLPEESRRELATCIEKAIKLADRIALQAKG